MRISIDLDSVSDTSRVLMAAADEYDRSASALASGDGVGGVTGPQRMWLLSAVDSVASRVRMVAAQHREMAAELTRRACCAADSASPVYAGIAVAGAQIAFDRDGDGINDTVAIDQDGDGFFEAFALDTQQDGFYDMVMVSDLSGNLLGAGFDSNQDGHMESFIGVQPTGAVFASDPDGDGAYSFAPLAAGGASVVGGFGSYSAGLVGPLIGGGFATAGSTISSPDFVISGSAIIGGGYYSNSNPTVAEAIISGASIVGGGHYSNSYSTLDANAIISAGSIVGGSSAGASGQTWLGNLANMGGSPSVLDADPSAMFDVWMDDPGRQQPELGRADTYNWMDDPRLDSDGDNTPNRFDNHLRDYDRR